MRPRHVGAYSTSLLDSTSPVLYHALIASIAGVSVLGGPNPAAVGAPSGRASSPSSAPSSTAAAPEDNDVAIVLDEVQGDYLAARARLEASPALAAPAIERRLGDRTLDPAQRRRLLHTLVAIQPLRASPWLRDELRVALTTGQDDAPWRSLLSRLPDRGEATLIDLVGDPKLPVAARASLLEPLVSASSNPARFAPLVGRGNRQLERVLRRLLRSRAKLDPAARSQLVTALDDQISAGLAPAGVVLLRGAIGSITGATRAKIIELAVSADTPFDVAVACLSVLAAPPRGPSPPEFLAFARDHLSPARRADTSSTIFSAFALAALDDADARALIAEFDLLDTEEPRLYALALGRGSLDDPARAWLHDALDNPWPEVQLAAIGRIDAPCDPSVIAALLRTAERTDDPGPTVERAAIRSLGRCGADALKPLTALMSNPALPPWKRADAATQVILVAPERADDVAAMMRGPDDSVSLALLEALRSLRAPSDALVDSACHLRSEREQLKAPARRSLKAWGALRRCE